MEIWFLTMEYASGHNFLCNIQLHPVTINELVLYFQDLPHVYYVVIVDRTTAMFLHFIIMISVFSAKQILVLPQTYRNTLINTFEISMQYFTLISIAWFQIFISL